MKAQGLPMSTIVLIILSILVLVGLVLLFIRAFQTQPIDTQAAVNNCNSKCLLESQYAQGQISAYNRPISQSPFCSVVQEIKGMGSKRCDEIAACRVTRGDGGSCTIVCNIAGGLADCGTGCVGPGEAGDSCTANSDCCSGVCSDNVCA